MNGRRSLVEVLGRACAQHADRVALCDGVTGVSITYRQLGEHSDRLRDRLRHLGVGAGDRVGLYLPKSIDAVIGMLGVLKAGAGYVPVDPEAPAQRGALIMADCAVRAVIASAQLSPALISALAAHAAVPPLLLVHDDAQPRSDKPDPTVNDGPAVLPIVRALDDAQRSDPAPPSNNADVHADDLAYILYTSGSTGRPKGVRLSHRAALSFIGWCEAEFRPLSNDVYSSHAPLHFDLSIHDVFVALANGARLVLIGEELGRDPLRLADTIERERITVWYSTPSILNLLAVHGKLERHDATPLRLVLFAGEVFPLPQLRALKRRWSQPQYYNLYGPTETNVCTFFKLPAVIPDDRTAPFPIGRMCPPLRGRVLNAAGDEAPRGAEGELVVAGAGVMDGYWNLPESTEQAFITDSTGERWYRTGDLVVEDEHGVYHFHGRRDRMVKRRGYRVELGEIEAGLAAHPNVREVAVVALDDADHGVRIKAFLGVDAAQRPSIIALKQFSVERLPRYMVPDTFEFVPALPRTSTDKVDYQSLLTRG